MLVTNVVDLHVLSGRYQGDLRHSMLFLNPSMRRTFKGTPFAIGTMYDSQNSVNQCLLLIAVLHKLVTS